MASTAISPSARLTPVTFSPSLPPATPGVMLAGTPMAGTPLMMSSPASIVATPIVPVTAASPGSVGRQTAMTPASPLRYSPGLTAAEVPLGTPAVATPLLAASPGSPGRLATPLAYAPAATPLLAASPVYAPSSIFEGTPPPAAFVGAYPASPLMLQQQQAAATAAAVGAALQQQTAHPTIEELHAHGFYPLETLQVQQDGQLTTYIRALTKHGFKVLILLDSPLTPIQGFANVHLRYVKPEQPVEMPEHYRDVCKMCHNEVAEGVFFERDGNWCHMRPERMMDESNKEYVVVKEYLYSSMGGDPRGIFKHDALPYPIVSMAAIRMSHKVAHCKIAEMSKAIAATLLARNLAKLTALEQLLRATADQVCEFRKGVHHKVMHLNEMCRKLREYDEYYEHANLCTMDQCDAKGVMAKRGAVWENLTHRQMMYGHLVYHSNIVAHLIHPITEINQVVVMEHEMLHKKFHKIEEPLAEVQYFAN